MAVYTFDVCGYLAYDTDEVKFMSVTRSNGMHIKGNPDIKTSVEPILAEIGLFLTMYKLTLRQIYLKRKIPFELSSVN